MESQLRAEMQAAFDEYDRQVRINNIKVGCVLGMLLMPAGWVLDYFVYRPEMVQFLMLRLMCSLLIGVFFAFLLTPFGREHCRAFGMILLMLPTTCISFMIYLKEGASSPYYGGLNLVLLSLGLVLRWTFRESLVAVALVLGTYQAACYFHGFLAEADVAGKFVNNLYFMVTTGIVVATSGYFLSLLRFREFAGRYELDRNKRELEQTNQKLVEMDQMKSRFFANISHELRTPLTLLLGPLETLQHQREGLAAEQTTELLAAMFSNGMRLLKLINDLLELVRLDAGIMRVKREPAELGGIIRGLASAARQLAEEKHLRLETFVDPALGRVMVDRDKLEKIILNLQFNALKFTPPGGGVEVRGEQQGDELVIQVKDTGMGIGASDLPSVFSRFWQADTSAQRKYRGVGIGLALVKELTELQGGTVSVQSEEGKGTTFTVRLPFIPAGETTRLDQTYPDQAGLREPAKAGAEIRANDEWLENLYHRAELLPGMNSGHRPLPVRPAPHRPDLLSVLIAEDEPDMLRFLKMQLENHYQVLEATNGQQAIDETGRSLPDLVLLDMMMPEKDGLQVCQEIREHAATRNIPIVLLTARADEESRLAALSAGASDFLSKPFSTTELQVRVRNLVESSQYQKSLARQNQVLKQTIEELKETESQLVQSEKLASLGRMSAGMIHEINNPLTYAKTGLYTLRQYAQGLPPPQRACFEETLGDIEDGITRIKNIVADLGPFTRQQSDARDMLRVEALVEVALRFLSHDVKDAVKVEKTIPPDLVLWGNQTLVIQVLINLLQNSLDALKQKQFSGEQASIWITGRAEHDRCFLAIRDNGPGIPPEIMPRVFEPFFSTKEVGVGMGLGLNICYRIMQAHRGKIEAVSEPGKFCSFTLEFPLRKPEPENP